MIGITWLEEVLLLLLSSLQLSFSYCEKFPGFKYQLEPEPEPELMSASTCGDPLNASVWYVRGSREKHFFTSWPQHELISSLPRMPWSRAQLSRAESTDLSGWRWSSWAPPLPLICCQTSDQRAAEMENRADCSSISSDMRAADSPFTPDGKNNALSLILNLCCSRHHVQMKQTPQRRQRFQFISFCCVYWSSEEAGKRRVWVWACFVCLSSRRRRSRADEALESKNKISYQQLRC